MNILVLYFIWNHSLLSINDYAARYIIFCHRENYSNANTCVYRSIVNTFTVVHFCISTGLIADLLDMAKTTLSTNYHYYQAKILQYIMG